MIARRATGALIPAHAWAAYKRHKKMKATAERDEVLLPHERIHSYLVQKVVVTAA
jgi:hypothetical protein